MSDSSSSWPSIWASISALASGFSVLYAYKATQLMSLDKDSRTLIDLVSLVQEDKARTSRQVVFKKYENDQVLHEDVHMHVEDMCWRYDVCGILTKGSPELRKKFISSWGYSISEGWKMVEKVVLSIRVTRKNPVLWDDFEELARDAIKHHSRKE